MSAAAQSSPRVPSGGALRRGWLDGREMEQQGMDVALAVTRGAAVGSGTTKFWEGRRSRKSCYKKTVSRCP